MVQGSGASGLSHPGVYDEIGHGYRHKRVPDFRIAAQIERALGDARRICNVGAGAGSYEPSDREVIAVEPSRRMLAQRSPGPALRAAAEALPFCDGAFDAVMALLTLHHWVDARAGLAELRRIAPRRVLFHFDPDPEVCRRFWLVRDYLPQIVELESHRAPAVDSVAHELGADRVEVIPVPHDCSDGFQCAYWRRPRSYLNPAVRASISSLAQLPIPVVDAAMARLARDLESGTWASRNAELLEREEMDYGYRLIVADG